MRIRWTIVAAVLLCVVTHADQPDPAAKRFDLVVREDIFAGFGGDETRMAVGLKKIDETLAKNPKHAEALVWRGAARVFQSAKLFEKQKIADGMALWTAGLKDMDEAVALEPKNPGVRIPRAAALLPAAHNAPALFAKPLLPKVVNDFETMYEMQKDHLATLGTHPLGELRMGLADAYRLSGQADKSKTQLEAILKDLPGTKYEKVAKKWLAAEPTAKLAHSCIGCHKPR